MLARPVGVLGGDEPNLLWFVVTERARTLADLSWAPTVAPPTPPWLLAVGCALVSSRWRSLLVTVVAGLSGFLIGHAVS